MVQVTNHVVYGRYGIPLTRTKIMHFMIRRIDMRYLFKLRTGSARTHFFHVNFVLIHLALIRIDSTTSTIFYLFTVIW
jgi:hypothetical protein